MAKMPTSPYATDFQVFVLINLIQKCHFCSKAFSTDIYRTQHEKRRHEGLISPPEPSSNEIKVKVNEKPSNELQRIVELIEAFTTQKKETDKDKEEESITRERLKLEQEFQEMRVKNG
jgi:uncharacterized Ntn-hydrolase superfamily protein